MIVRRYILIRLPRIRLITYSSISSLSLVTKHQFTNNMFIFYTFIISKGKILASILSSGGETEETKRFKQFHANITFFFQMEELPTRLGVHIINMLFIETVFSK